MKKILLSFCILFSLNLTAQIPDGSIAPNFKAVDINGEEHNLYDILDSGRDVIIDFSATWCGPCWSFHTSGILDELYHDVGPDGSNEAMILMVECDVTTTSADLNGMTTATAGNWVAGTPYPIIDNSGIASSYQVGSYPTIMKICQDRRTKLIGSIRSAGAQFGKDELGLCPSVEYASEPFFFADKYVGCGDLDIQFSDDSWPRPDSWEWDFGDGTTSNEQNPFHVYDEPGNYDVTLKVANTHGENTVNKASLIQVGEGDAFGSQQVGPLNFDIGTGRYFEGGHQALIFNAAEDIILGSVNVFSNKEETRTVVLLDNGGNLIQSKQFTVGEGEHRLDLEFFVPKGTDYRLGLRSDAFFFRNDGGVNYPYEVDGLVTIHSSTAGTSPLQYYYYFYDWDVRKAGCNGLISTEDISTDKVELYPNPASDVLIVEQEMRFEGPVRVLNSLGQSLSLPQEINVNQLKVTTSSLETGLYMIELNQKLHKFYKK